MYNEGTLRLRTGEVDIGRQRLVTPNGVIPLTTRETELLTYLADRAGEAVSREDLLVEVWNYRASNPTRAVDLAVKRLRSKIEPDPSEPVHILSVHGLGYRFVPAEDAPPQTRAQGRPAARPTSNLAAERTSFIGRQRELSRLSELLLPADGRSQARLVTVTGPAGTGKTRLARKFGVDLAGLSPAAFPGGQWFVDLSEVRDLDGMLQAVVAALPLRAPIGASVEQVGRALSEHGSEQGAALVILDNFEQLVECATSTVGAWLDRVRQVCFLVTSRERLHVRGERILELSSLPPEDALSLLLERAAAVRRGASLGEEERVVLAGVAQQLDGIPLAIELAASRLGTLSPAQLQKRLASRFRLLGDPRSDRPKRHATLLAALDWSWELMTAHERVALAALSVFEGGFSLEAAEEILDEPLDPASPPGNHPWPADLIQSLRDKSLLTVDDLSDGDLRYRLLESIREYATQKLASMGPQIERLARERHATYYLREAEDLVSRLYGAAAVDRMEDLARERANLVAVARAAPSSEVRIRAVLSLYPVLAARGPLVLLEELLGSAIALGREQESIDRRLLGRLLVDRGFHLYGRGDLAGTISDLEEAARCAPQHLAIQARARMGLGRALCDLGRLSEAALALREAIDLFGRLGDRSGEGRARSIFAEVLTQQDCVEEAASEYDRALRVVRRVGDRWTEGVLYGNLAAFLLVRARDPVGADRYASEAYTIFTEVGDHRSSLLLLTGFAIALVRMARAAEALPRLDTAATIAREMSDRPREAEVRSVRGWALFELGRLEEAEAEIEEAVGPLRQTGSRAQHAIVLRRLGALRQEQQRWVEAEHALLEARDELAVEGNCIERSVTHLQIAQLQLETGRQEQALASLALSSADAGGKLPWVERQCEALSAVALALLGRHTDAAERLKAMRLRSLDPREAALVSPVSGLLSLLSASEAERPVAVARAESLLAAQQLPDASPQAGEARLVCRLLAAQISSQGDG